MSPVGSFFLPSPETAQSIDDKVRSQLVGSLPWLGETFDALNVDAAQTEKWTARPVDFGFYFELASAVHHDSATAANDETAPALESLVASIHGGGVGQVGTAPQVKTMSSEHYAQAEHDTLIRWFDLEPENRMALLPLDDDEFAASKGDLEKAIDLIRTAAPELYGEMNALTQEFIFAKPGPDARLSFGGASSYALWGAVALNGHAHPNWWDYAPRVVHEYSHNLLFGIASDEALVQNDPDERYPSPLRQEARPIDGIYHACYVSGRETYLMDALLKSVDQSQIDDAAVSAFKQYQQKSATNYADCKSVLDEHARYTELGKSVLNDTAAYMDARD